MYVCMYVCMPEYNNVIGYLRWNHDVCQKSSRESPFPERDTVTEMLIHTYIHTCIHTLRYYLHMVSTMSTKIVPTISGTMLFESPS